MSVIVIAERLWVCQDCTMLIANAELGQGDEAAEIAHAERMVAHIRANFDAKAIDMVLDSCTEHEPDRDCSCAHTGFYDRRCDACGDILAGYRHRAVILGRKNEGDVR